MRFIVVLLGLLVLELIERPLCYNLDEKGSKYFARK